MVDRPCRGLESATVSDYLAHLIILQFRIEGSDSRASRTMEQVGTVAQIRDAAVTQLRSGLNFGRRCSWFRK
jgi:hypothetical protein